MTKSDAASLPRPDAEVPSADVHFGGPDRPARRLRDVLEAHVRAVPAGGEIAWMTYYFRDRALADALIAAGRRGVRLRLAIEGAPRLAGANDAVLARLKAELPPEQLWIGRPTGPLSAVHPHLHAKIYVFTAPRPVALVGSFNPSGDEPEDPEVVRVIGDQDRGHNLLIGLRDPLLVEGLRTHVERYMTRPLSRLRVSPDQNRPLHAGDSTIYFFPRLQPGVIDRELDRLGPGCSVRAAVSHMKGRAFVGRLAAAARRGADVRAIVHHTHRRVPPEAERVLTRAGVTVRRYSHPDELPMHAKFVLVETPTDCAAFFGSYNYNPRSRYLNHELLVRSADAALFACLAERFAALEEAAGSAD